MAIAYSKKIAFVQKTLIIFSSVVMSINQLFGVLGLLLFFIEANAWLVL